MTASGLPKVTWLGTCWAAPFSLCYRQCLPTSAQAQQPAELSPPRGLRGSGGLWLLGLTVPSPLLAEIWTSRAPRREGGSPDLVLNWHRTNSEGRTITKVDPPGSQVRNKMKRNQRNFEAGPQRLSYITFPTTGPSGTVIGYFVFCFKEKTDSDRWEGRNCTKT